VRPEALEVLMAYEWPGNVRELINALERAVLLAQGEEVDLTDLPDALVGEPRRGDAVRGTGGSPGGPPAERPTDHDSPVVRQPLREARKEVVAAFERDYLIALLRENQGRMGPSAQEAGINPRSLFDLLRRHRIRKEDFKP
jgi:DNA-binding NtrC family response regulator